MNGPAYKPGPNAPCHNAYEAGVFHHTGENSGSPNLRLFAVVCQYRQQAQISQFGARAQPLGNRPFGRAVAPEGA
jgi:hypothetical protein